jgi:superfamily II DNA helicase RecQ
LTATATPEIAEDICKSFKIDIKHGVFRTAMYRPKYESIPLPHNYPLDINHDSIKNSLSFLVKTASSLNDKITQVVPILKSRTGPAIVYVTLQHQAEDTAMELKNHGLDAKVYHAGIASDERQAIQDYFMASAKGIVRILAFFCH